VLIEDAAHHARKELAERQWPIGHGEAGTGAGDETAHEDQG
jgi:hypothetical protein